MIRLLLDKHSVEVFINGQMVYEYGYDRFMEGKTVGTGYQFVDFPNNYKGKTLVIKFCVTEDNVFSKLDPIRN